MDRIAIHAVHRIFRYSFARPPLNSSSTFKKRDTKNSKVRFLIRKSGTLSPVRSAATARGFGSQVYPQKIRLNLSGLTPLQKPQAVGTAGHFHQARGSKSTRRIHYVIGQAGTADFASSANKRFDADVTAQGNDPLPSGWLEDQLDRRLLSIGGAFRNFPQPACRKLIV